MPATRSLADCQRLCDDVVKASGSVPAPLQRLLDAADILMTPAATGGDVLKPILDKALAGELLDAKSVDKMLATAATQQQVAEFRQGLRQAAEPAIVTRFHRELASGCADELLSSMRDAFDEAAKGLARARAAGINSESDPSFILSTGDANTVAEWKALPQHLAVVSGIGAVARLFGCRPTAQFSQIREYAGAENYRLEDAALMCCAGNLVAESAMFVRPDPIGHRASPWARCVLRLNTISEARDRYRSFAESEFDRVNDRALGGWVDQETGQVHPHPRPQNPYRAEVSA